MRRMLASAIVSICSAALVANAADSARKWVGSWSAAPYDVGASNMPPSPGLASNSLRQIVRVSIGGDSIRVKFSNGVGTSALTMNAVTVAISPDGKDAIDASSLKTLTFNGKSSVSIHAAATVTSDPVAFPLKPSARLAITIQYGQIPSPLTGHVGARGPSYLLAGDKTKATNFSGAATTEHWYTIHAIEVLASANAAAVAVLGNSITDGYGLTGGLQNRWTDVFSEALLANAATSQVGVLNLGIGGTNVASGTTGGLSRCKRDILEQNGLRWFVVFYGVNDIGAGASATTIIDAYKQMIADAHAKNVKVYGVTITPFGGNGYYSAAHETVRSAVNAWIRTVGNFDAVIDFDKVVRNPDDTTSFQASLKNDGLHPNVAGYKALGQSVDLKLFGATPSATDKYRRTPLRRPESCLQLRDGTLSMECDAHRLNGQRAPKP